MMPGINGAELRNRVRAASPELAARFVFVDESADVHAVCDMVRCLIQPGRDTIDTTVASR